MGLAVNAFSFSLKKNLYTKFEQVNVKLTQITFEKLFT